VSAKRRRPSAKRATKKRPQSTALVPSSRRVGVREVGAAELRALKRDLERASGALGGPKSAAPRWNADPDDVQRSVARLVLSLVEFLRKLLERQAIRRMDAGTLSSGEIEKIGVALMQLEKTLHGIAKRFGLTPQELNLDLGPLGRLH
jgi:hypothetical protein